jgi:hypothetical protein
MEDAPTFRTTIELRDTPQAVTTLNPATILKHENQRIEVIVHDVHEVVVVKY